MADLSLSLTDGELVDEVRDAMAGLDSSNVPDDTITQTSEKFVVPLLNDITSGLTVADHQDTFDNVVIAWTAELSFDAWLTFTRVRDREVETYIDPKQYRKQLQKRTNYALQLLDATRPSEVPKNIMTVKHDGEYRTIELQRTWEYDAR